MSNGVPQISQGSAAVNDQLKELLLCCFVLSPFAATRLPRSFISTVNLSPCRLSRGQNVLHAPLFCPSSVSNLLKGRKPRRTVGAANTEPCSKSVSAVLSHPSTSKPPSRTFTWTCGRFSEPTGRILPSGLELSPRNAQCLLSLFIPLVVLRFCRALMGLSGSVNPLTRRGRCRSDNMILRAASRPPSVRQ